MAEILTESFCERCGTRYTFESSAPRKRLGSFRTLSRGLKNFVLSDDTSLDEALAAARSDQEREATAQQLDAFHKTFNFCMSCRQYTCANCWNEVEARCLSCAPHLGQEILSAPFPDLAVGAEHGGDLPAYAATNGHAHKELEAAWPTTDLERPALSVEPVAAAPEAVTLAAAEPPEAGPAEGTTEAEPATESPVAAEAPVAAAAPEPEAVPAPVEAIEPVSPDREAVSTIEPGAEQAAHAAIEPEAVPETPAEPDVPQPVAPKIPPARRRAAGETVDDKAAAAAAQTAELLARFRPGQSIDDALEAFETERARQEPATPAEQARQEPSPPGIPDLASPAPVATAAEAESPPETLPAEAPPPEGPAAEAPAAETRPAAVPAAAADDRVEVPTWRTVAPESPPRTADGHLGELPAAPAPSQPAAPEWPTVPQWPARPQEPSGIAAILAARGSGATAEALWAASSHDVLASPSPASAPTGVQSCVSCGLSLSATARFCRRCGTRQGA